jgi:hypothetical protein
MMGKEYDDQEHWVKIQDIDVGDTFITRSSQAEIKTRGRLSRR